MAEPVKLGSMDAVPPALRYQLRDALGLMGDGELGGVARTRWERVVNDGGPWIGADPSLAEIGYWMIDAKHGAELRTKGCEWLSFFPSVETVKRLAKVLTDAPATVRDAAIATLGDRQVRQRHASTKWTVETVHAADEVLEKLADAETKEGKIASDALPIALRAVQSELVAAIFAKAPGLWGNAIEAFATAPLARVLFVSLPDIAPQHRLRVLRLIAATLGEEAVPLLIARSRDAAIGERLEMLFLAISLGGEQHLPRLEEALKDMRIVDHLRKRARWHVQHRGVVPTVRGLRVARTTALMGQGERAAACVRAAEDLGALAKFERHHKAYISRMWGWMVIGAKDPALARELVGAHPESQAQVRDLYLEDLARRGRIQQLAAAAQGASGADVGALWLATCGRPFAALELAETARHHTPELVCARVLASYRAGRPDLAQRILAEDMPASEITDNAELPPFPGPHETWMIANAPTARPALAALASGMDAVLALSEPGPLDGEPDRATLEPVAAVVRRLGRGFPGSTAYIAGVFQVRDRALIERSVVAAGARLVAGPFPGTDYYVFGDVVPVQIVAQLERQGARRIRPGELEGV
ncbi:hypothetical protein BH11MYX2_BH11MYX2_09210 [soil metagenome]